MARNEVDSDAVERLVSHWKQEIADECKTISKIKKEILKVAENAKKSVEIFNNSEYPSFKVSEGIMDYVKEGDVFKAMQQLHIASYKLQELSALFKTDYNIKAIECINDANVIEMEVHTTYSTDSSCAQLLGSNASIERYWGVISLEMQADLLDIQTSKKVIDELSKYVEEQLYALSRLDGVLKYSNSLQTAELMNSANRGII